MVLTEGVPSDSGAGRRMRVMGEQRPRPGPSRQTGLPPAWLLGDDVVRILGESP